MDSKKLDLQQLREWEEIATRFVASGRRNLILFFDQEQIVELSNKDHRERYETVYKHLKKEFPLIEKIQHDRHAGDKVQIASWFSDN